MTAVAVAMCVVAMGLGALLIVAARRPLPCLRSRGAPLWTRHVSRWLWLSGSAGIVAWLVTSLPILIVATPLVAAVVRWLLSSPKNSEVELLEALDRWLRALSSLLTSGKSIIDALRISRRSAPALLEPHLSLALQRLDERWSVREALQAMADDLASPQTDAVLAGLILAHERGGGGVSATLVALADSVQDQLRAWREIEAEREKPRVVVRQVTGLSLVVIGVGLVIGRGYFAPYRTPAGQGILGALLCAYAGSLVYLRRLTAARRRARILVRKHADA